MVFGMRAITTTQFGYPQARTMEAHEYLRKYVRSLPGGCIAWSRSLFTCSGQWDSGELIDAAVDIAWETFYPENVLERPSMIVRRSGSFMVFRLNIERVEDILGWAA